VSDTLFPVEHCAHDSGEIVMMNDGLMRCGDCHCVMVLVPQEWLQKILVEYRDLKIIERMEKGL